MALLDYIPLMTDHFSIQCDLTSPEAIQKAAQEIKDGFGSIYAIINAAAYIPGALLKEISLADTTRCFQVIYLAPLLLAQALLPIISNPGRIINITSSTTVSAHPGLGVYASVKMGLVGLTRTMAAEFAEYGLTVNAISPGFTRHAGNLSTVPKAVEDAEIAMQRIKKPPRPEDYCGLLELLLSEGSNALTGQNFNVRSFLPVRLAS
jgi:NAD(P)-dependent dehydrogenase (short-subunit alcohol dehydrogenase family)